MTLYELALDVSRKKLKPSSEAVYRSLWKKFCAATRVDENPRFLSDIELRQALTAVGAYSTQKKTLGLFKWVAKTLEPKGILLGNAYEYVEQNYFEKSTHNYSLNGSKAIPLKLAAATNTEYPDWKGKRLAAVMWVLWDCGPQQSELLALEWRDFLFSSTEGSSVVVGEGRKRRELPLSREAAEALLLWRGLKPSFLPRESPWLALSTGKPLEPSTLWRQLKRLEGGSVSVEASMTGPTAFRASYAKRLHEAGYSINEIKEKLGHSLETSTQELVSHLGLV